MAEKVNDKKMQVKAEVKAPEKAKPAEKPTEKKEEKYKTPNAIQKWYRETIGELRKVSWPTPREAWRLTKIVLLVMVAMSLSLGLFDFIFSWVITRLLA